jgi:hypothetical protein
MSTLAEIETAVESLPPEQKKELVRFLTAQLRPAVTRRSRIVRQEGDAFLEAPADAPPMTPEYVKQPLEDWP